MPFVALPGTARWLYVSAVAVCGCYPEFVFDGAGGDGGAGTTAETSTARVAVGTGGSTGEGPSPTTTTGHMNTTSSTGPSTNSSSSTGMPPVVQVSCGPAFPDLAPCEAGQVCCFNIFDGLFDNCNSACDPKLEYTFGCDGPQDCSVGQVCCASVSGSSVVGIGCAGGCASPNIELCESDGDCTAGTCQVVFADAGYDTDYKGCE